MPKWAAGAPAETQAQGAQLFREACAACHGVDGKGAPRALVGFAEPLPDFTDCKAFVREANTDWLAVIHRGGPARGFNRLMPSFHEALTPEQIDSLVAHVRSLCQDDSWPRGELNLPRPFFTEKAYPEDEITLATGVGLSGAGSISNQLVFEERLGALWQLEVVLPFAYQTGPSPDGWQLGVGDIAFAVKRVLFHSLRSGSILSISGELALPTGDVRRGFGIGSTLVSPALHFGQLWPGVGFFQAQTGVDLPFHTAEKEAFARAVVGRSFNQSGGLGRRWSPMVELVATRPFSSGADVNWNIVPQCQVTLSRRQHIMASVGVQVPIHNPGASTALYLYLLWDFFDGGLGEGW